MIGITEPRRTNVLDLDVKRDATDPAEDEADAFAVDTLFPDDRGDLIVRATCNRAS
ncbi:hypothetical protein ABIA33_002349 [Streptacidiphilus sp. MAP12-16]|uniref:hypothetical protein n=1 Tax=Streptacidiphilus sp. MAP12-16 TaxID=3156300 RepID=UPI0035187B32